LYQTEIHKTSTSFSVEEETGWWGGVGYQRNIVLCKCARSANFYPTAAEESAVTGRTGAKCLGQRLCEDPERVACHSNVVTAGIADREMLQVLGFILG